MKHMLVEYVGGKAKVKCGAEAGRDQVTVWRSDVTCPSCRAVIGGLRLVKPPEGGARRA